MNALSSPQVLQVRVHPQAQPQSHPQAPPQAPPQAQPQAQPQAAVDTHATGAVGFVKFRQTAQRIKTLSVLKKTIADADLDRPDTFLAKHGTSTAPRPAEAGTPGAAEGTAPTGDETSALRRLWHTWVIDPASDLYYRWLLVSTVIVLYNVMMVIARAVLPRLNADGIVVWLVVDYISDCFYLADIFVSTRKVYLEEGLVVVDVRRLALKYLHTVQSKLDVLSLLPTDLLYIHFGLDTAIVRVNRVLRAPKIAEFFERTDSRSNFPYLFRVAQLVLYVIIIYHWNACFFYQISSWIGFCHDQFVYFTSACPQYMMVAEPESLLTTYTYTFYWSTLMLATICDLPHPVAVHEYIYNILVFLVGILIFAAIIGNVGGIISAMNSSREAYQARMDGVKRYMALRSVPMELQSRVIRWFDYVWTVKKGVDDTEALSVLPQNLRAEIAKHVHLADLKRVAIFQECEAGLLTELVMKLRPAVFSPGDYVCLKGDIGKELYIIKKGKLEVVSDDGTKVFATLGEGVVFGEISILNIAGNKNGNKRTANIRSLGYTDLFVLSKEDLWEALAEYPDARRALKEKGREQLRKDNLLDEELAGVQELDQRSSVEKLEHLARSVSSMLEEIEELMREFDVVQRRLKQRITAAEIQLRNHLMSTGRHDDLMLY